MAVNYMLAMEVIAKCQSPGAWHQFLSGRLEELQSAASPPPSVTGLPFLQITCAHVEREVSGNQGRNFQDGHFMGMFDSALCHFTPPSEAGRRARGPSIGEMIELPSIDLQRAAAGSALEWERNGSNAI